MLSLRDLFNRKEFLHFDVPKDKTAKVGWANPLCGLRLGFSLGSSWIQCQGVPAQVGACLIRLEQSVAGSRSGAMEADQPVVCKQPPDPEVEDGMAGKQATAIGEGSELRQAGLEMDIQGDLFLWLVASCHINVKWIDCATLGCFGLKR